MSFPMPQEKRPGLHRTADVSIFKGEFFSGENRRPFRSNQENAVGLKEKVSLPIAPVHRPQFVSILNQQSARYATRCEDSAIHQTIKFYTLAG